MKLLFALLFILISHLAKAADQLPPETCARWYSSGISKLEGHDKLINVSEPGTADVRPPFVHLLLEGGRNIVTEGANPQARATDMLETIVSRTDFNAENVTRTAEDVIDTLVANHSIINPLTRAKVDFEYVHQRLVETLRSLYGRFNQQRHNRRENIPLYQGQDARKGRYATRFTTLFNGEYLSHIQVLSSWSPRQELNFEEKFQTRQYINRVPGELVHEVGRLDLMRWKKLSPEAREALLRMGLTPRMLLTRTLQKAVTWLARDVGAERVFFHVNGTVLQILYEVINPEANKEFLFFNRIYSTKNIPTLPPGEFIVEVKGPRLKDIEVRLLNNMIKHHIYRDLTTLRERDVQDFKWSWIFWPNEWEALSRSVLGKFAYFYGQSVFLNNNYDSTYLPWPSKSTLILEGDEIPTPPGLVQKVLGKLKASLTLTFSPYYIEQLQKELEEYEPSPSIIDRLYH